jgi:hypothetical protein
MNTDKTLVFNLCSSVFIRGHRVFAFFSKLLGVVTGKASLRDNRTNRSLTVAAPIAFRAATVGEPAIELAAF